MLRKVIAEHFPRLKWHEGAKTYRWYGSWQNDFSEEQAAYRRGIDVSQYGKSDHKCSLDGCDYDIGITKRTDGTGYSIVWDTWSQGKKISAYIGDDAEKLLTKYAEEFTRQFSQQEGYMMNRTEDSEFVFLELSK